jgi:hypothetical protein
VAPIGSPFALFVCLPLAAREELGQRLPDELRSLSLLAAATREAVERLDRRLVY